MEALAFKKMIEDLSIPDDAVLKEMKLFTNDRYRHADCMTDEEKRVVDDIEELAVKIRPVMMDKFYDDLSDLWND